DLALEQRARCFRRLLVGREQLHAPFVERLAHRGIGERVAKRHIEPIDDRPRRAGGREQDVPEPPNQFLVTCLRRGRAIRWRGERGFAEAGVSLEVAGLDQRPEDRGRLATQVGVARQQVVERRPAPRYGTCVTVAPISWANSMPHRCANEPTPACATLAFCPGSFSQRTSTAMVLGGSIGLPTTVVAATLTGPIAMKSFSVSNPGLAYSVMAIATAGLCSSTV